MSRRAGLARQRTAARCMGTPFRGRKTPAAGRMGAAGGGLIDRPSEGLERSASVDLERRVVAQPLQPPGVVVAARRPARAPRSTSRGRAASPRRGATPSSARATRSRAASGTRRRIRASARPGTTPSSASSQKPARSSRIRPFPSRANDHTVPSGSSRRGVFQSPQATTGAVAPRGEPGAHRRERLGLDQAVGRVGDVDDVDLDARRSAPRAPTPATARRAAPPARAARATPAARRGGAGRRAARAGSASSSEQRTCGSPSVAHAAAHSGRVRAVTSCSASRSGSRAPAAAACCTSACARRATFQEISRTTPAPGPRPARAGGRAGSGCRRRARPRACRRARLDPGQLRRVLRAVAAREEQLDRHARAARPRSGRRRSRAARG